MSTEFSAIRWQPFPTDASQGSQLGWLQEKIPYKLDANALQTLDIWLPADQQNVPPALDEIHLRKGTWVIYIHGGAWRDPVITSSAFSHTVRALLSNPETHGKIGGLASLGYSLSPHPLHAENPSPPKDSTQAVDPSRMAKHPDHIMDVIDAIKFLQDKANFGSNYILIGHSCGATLALQVAMDNTSWYEDQRPPQIDKPSIIIGLNGLYDLPELIQNPGPKHQHLIPVYTQFTRLAFGDNGIHWLRASPISFHGWAQHWSSGKKVVLAQSKDDSLVPYRQTASMLANLNDSLPVKLAVREVQIPGDHNDIWQQGTSLAEIVVDLIENP